MTKNVWDNFVIIFFVMPQFLVKNEKLFLIKSLLFRAWRVCYQRGLPRLVFKGLSPTYDFADFYLRSGLAALSDGLSVLEGVPLGPVHPRLDRAPPLVLRELLIKKNAA